MRKFYLLIAGAFFAFLQVVNAQGTPLLSTKASSAIVIDASGSDAVWTSAPWVNIAVTFTGEESGFTDAADLTGKFKVADDASKVYFLFDITDDIITQDPAAHWVGDKVEMYFGLPGYVPTSNAHSDHTRQFAIKAQADPTIPGENGSNNYPGSADLATDGVEYAYVENLSGYVLEVSIDKAIALEAVPGSTTIAFDVCIADNDEAGAAGIRYRKSWFNNGAINELWNSMIGAGQLTLSLDNTALNIDRASSRSAYISNSTLKFKGYDNAVDVEIYSILGQKMLTAKKVSELNISDLQKGIYMVRVNNGKQVFKVIK
jgi:hypothetical protein